MTNSTFRDNEATGNGGSIYTGQDVSLSVTDCLFENNKANDGGAIFFDETGATITIDSSQFIGNSGTGDSGVITDATCCGSTTATINDSYFAFNNSVGSSAIEVNGSAVSINRSSFFLNTEGSQATSVRSGNGTTNLINCSFINNIGNPAVDVDGGTTNITNSTIFLNIGDSDQGALTQSGGTANLTNSILSHNASITTAGSECGGTITSGDWNISRENGAACGLIAGNDKPTTDPEIKSVGWHSESGPTALAVNTSPVVDTTAGGCPVTDQNGNTRDGNCDLGATEYMGGDPPNQLSYGASWIMFRQGVAITSLTPTVSGSVSSYSVSPTLPTGLSFDTSTGVISGTPTELTGENGTDYIFKATNGFGDSVLRLRIFVLEAFSVDSTADNTDVSVGDGNCADTNGNCTFRAAVQEAQATDGKQIIYIPENTTITIGSALPNITTPLAFMGGNQSTSIVTSANADYMATINAKGAKVHFYNLTFNQFSQAADGGWIFADNGAQLYLDQVTVSNCSATGGNDGGAIYAGIADLYIHRSTFSGNTAADGGAIRTLGDGFDNSVLFISDSHFESNIATGAGGAIDNQSYKLAWIQKSTFESNAADNGGAISDNVETTLIENSTFYQNDAGTNGTTFYLTSRQFVLSSSTVFSDVSAIEMIYGFNAGRRPVIADTVIINDNGAPDVCADDGSTSLGSHGGNLINVVDADCTTNGNDTTSGAVVIDFQTYGDHGGNTKTYSIGGASNAIDYSNGHSMACYENIDQAYRSRTSSSCDSGAYEF